jgi:hypothetical protein
MAVHSRRQSVATSRTQVVRQEVDTAAASNCFHSIILDNPRMLLDLLKSESLLGVDDQ